MSSLSSAQERDVEIVVRRTFGKVMREEIHDALKNVLFTNGVLTREQLQDAVSEIIRRSVQSHTDRSIKEAKETISSVIESHLSNLSGQSKRAAQTAIDEAMKTLNANLSAAVTKGTGNLSALMEQLVRAELSKKASEFVEKNIGVWVTTRVLAAPPPDSPIDADKIQIY